MTEKKFETNDDINKEEPSLEKMLQTYIQVEESEQEAKWLKGQLLNVILSNQPVSKKWLSSELHVSPAQIRVLVQVYQAFPKKETRVPMLSWYHHRVAANSPKPNYYIAEAYTRKLSTRELKDVIIEDEKQRSITKRKNRFHKLENIFVGGIQKQIQVLALAGKKRSGRNELSKGTMPQLRE